MLSMKERLISSLLSQKQRKKTELKEMRRRVGDLEEFVLSHFPFPLVQVTAVVTPSYCSREFYISGDVTRSKKMEREQRV